MTDVVGDQAAAGNPAVPLGVGVRVWVHGPDTEDSARFVAALKACGCRVGSDDPDAADVVIMTTDDPEVADAPAAGDVIPVSLRGRSGPLWPELSHIVLEPGAADDDVSRAAGRVAAIARIGGARIVQWNQLVSQARAWRAAPSTAPVAREDQLAAGYALAALVGEASSSAADVRAYLEESTRAVSRSRRRRTIFAVAFTVALVAVTVLAVTQTGRAASSTASARIAEATAGSERVAALAESLIARDPDVPAVLANEALALRATATARAATATIAASTLPHVSLPLSAGAARLDAADECAVVGFWDGRVELLSLETGAVLTAIETEDGVDTTVPATPVVAPDCGALAVFRSGAVDIYGADGVLSGSVSGIRWLDWGSELGLVAVDDEGVVVAVDETGRTEPLASLARDEPVSDAAVSGVGTIALATGAQVVVVDVASGRELYARDVDTGVAVELSDDGRYLYLLHGMSVTAIDWQRGVSTAASNGQGYVEPLARGLYAVSGLNGTLSLMLARNTNPLIAIPNGVGLAAVAAVGDSRLVTVGRDGMLRVWDVAPAVAAVGSSFQLAVPTERTPTVTARNRSAGSARSASRRSWSASTPSLTSSANRHSPTTPRRAGSGVPSQSASRLTIAATSLSSTSTASRCSPSTRNDRRCSRPSPCSGSTSAPIV